MARTPRSPSPAGVTALGLLLGSACLLVLAVRPAHARLAMLRDDVLLLDDSKASAADNTTTADTSAGDAKNGRKLLATQYRLQGGGAAGGFIACDPTSPVSKEGYCHGTLEERGAAKFEVYWYNGMYQFLLAGTNYCLTLFTDLHNQVRLYPCAQPDRAPWNQRWNLYKSYIPDTGAKGVYSIRTGDTFSSWALLYPGHGTPLQAGWGCNPLISVSCIMNAVQV